MGEEELRTIIETNFQLVAITMREASVRAGRMEQGLEEARTGLDGARRDLGEVKSLAAANQQSFLEVAEKLEAALAGLKSVAFGGVESRQRITALEEEMKEVRERLERLEKAS